MINVRTPTWQELCHWQKVSDVQEQVGENDNGFSVTFSSDPGMVLLAFYGSRPVGGIEFTQSKDVMTVHMLYVTADMRGKSLGTRLLDAVYRIAMDRHVVRLVLYSAPNAKPFYERYGFREAPKTQIVEMHLAVSQYQDDSGENS